jgi:hypothetical protein
MHTTIYAISESPKSPDVIWVGTDDGNLQLTRDGGKTGTNVVANIPGLPKNAWVSYVDAGHFDHHTFGDMKPYAYKTTDFGKTWTSLIAPNAPVGGYAHVLREDLINRHLLFLGTELGLWISVDGGAQWAQYKGGDLPNVAVRDLVIHPRDHDLVLATHGRGIWIVDDITPLRAMTAEALAKDVTFVGSETKEQRILAFFGDLNIEVFGPDGKSLGTIPSSKRRGLNRVRWSMRLKAPRVPPAASYAGGAGVGPRVVPGTYTVKMTKDRSVYETKLELVPDDRREQFALAMKLHEQLGAMTTAVERINSVRTGLDERASKLAANDALTKKLHAASAQVDALRTRVVATKEGGMITGEERLREHLANLYGEIAGYEGLPTQTQVERTDALTRELAEVTRDFDG